MYAHHVIEDLKKLKSMYIINDAWKYVEYLIPHIRNSKKIYVGNFGEIKDFFIKSKNAISSSTFTGYWKGLRLPFKSVWIDFDCSYIRDITEEEKFKGFTNVTKRGLLCRELADDLILVNFFSYRFEYKEWVTSMVETFISTNEVPIHKHSHPLLKQLQALNPIVKSIDDNFKIHDNYNKDKCLMWSNYITDGHKIAKGMGVSKESLDITNHKNTTLSVNTLCFALKLLSCKNIVKSNNPEPVKLNKKRISQMKEPVYRFYTLMVRPLRYEKEGGNKMSEKKGMTKLHICMGHMRHYSKEKPLFGKYVGPVWIQDHMRGDIKNGMITKDYHLLTK